MNFTNRLIRTAQLKISGSEKVLSDKLSKYDTMVRDEIRIKAEKEYLFQNAIAEGMAKGKVEGMAKGLAEGRAEGRAEGMAKGIAEGIAEGKAEAQREIAAKFKTMGISLESIALATGLTLEEVAAL